MLIHQTLDNDNKEVDTSNVTSTAMVDNDNNDEDATHIAIADMEDNADDDWRSVNSQETNDSGEDDDSEDVPMALFTRLKEKNKQRAKARKAECAEDPDEALFGTCIQPRPNFERNDNF